jgi:6-pyruvoyltetrahydropterin/6-carboxytetrahydropterin synthase
MFEIEKKFSFEAGHTLDHHDGKCQHPHGHSYKLRIKIRSKELITNGPERNMVIDFNSISEIVKPMIIQYLDHQWLNTSLNTDSPTAEFIARWIFLHLQPKLNCLFSVTVEETDSANATYIL